MMTLVQFDKLRHRDFENGAVLDEIREAFKEFAKLTAERDSLAEQLRVAKGALERLTSRLELCLRGVAEYTELHGLVAESRAALVPPSAPAYRHLEPGEIVQDGDEVEVSNSIHDPEKWQPAKCIGQPAPTRLPAHRLYRRPIKPSAPAEKGDANG